MYLSLKINLLSQCKSDFLSLLSLVVSTPTALDIVIGLVQISLINSQTSPCSSHYFSNQKILLYDIFYSSNIKQIGT